MKFLRMNICLTLALSLFATSVVPSNVQARSTQDYKMAERAASSKLADAFNKFRYQMTVEWDQRDPYFRDHAQKELENSLMNLKAEGITVDHMQAYMQSNILDSKSRVEYERLLSALKKQDLSEEDASLAAMKFMEKSYARGASFNGGGSASYKKVMIIVGVVIVGVVTYLVIRNCRKPGERQEQEDDSSASSTNVGANAESTATANANANADSSSTTTTTTTTTSDASSAATSDATAAATTGGHKASTSSTGGHKSSSSSTGEKASTSSGNKSSSSSTGGHKSSSSSTGGYPTNY